MCSNIGTPNNHHFPFGTNGKVVVIGVPILKHFMVILSLIGFLNNLLIVRSETTNELILLPSKTNTFWVLDLLTRYLSGGDICILYFCLSRRFDIKDIVST